jgi:hypothetical protein
MITKRFITIACVLLAVLAAAISAVQYYAPLKIFVTGGLEYTGYNNYIIFKQSFFHLVDGADLYILYPAEHWDLYKYSPTFSLLFVPFTILPDLIGLFVWNLLNITVLAYAFWKMFGNSGKTLLWISGFMLAELVTTTQNSQCNALIAGLIILAFLRLEKRQVAIAALLVVLTVFIKLAGIVALSIFIFYPNKLRSSLWIIGWFVILGVLPLVVVSPAELIEQYRGWLRMLQEDHSASYGLSVMGWLHSWFNLDVSKEVVLAAGTGLLLIPLLNYKQYGALRFRLFFLASVLIYMVIFNHKAESATFIIAVAGIAIWYFSQERKWVNLVLLLLAFIFTVLSPTDAFPVNIRNQYVHPYALKAVPCILVWFKIWWDMVTYRNSASEPPRP